MRRVTTENYKELKEGDCILIKEKVTMTRIGYFGTDSTMTYNESDIKNTEIFFEPQDEKWLREIKEVFYKYGFSIISANNLLGKDSFKILIDAETRQIIIYDYKNDGKLDTITIINPKLPELEMYLKYESYRIISLLKNMKF